MDSSVHLEVFCAWEKEKGRNAIIVKRYSFRTLVKKANISTAKKTNAEKPVRPPVKRSGSINQKTGITFAVQTMSNVSRNGERRIRGIGNGQKRPLRYKICYRNNPLKIIAITVKIQAMRYKICYYRNPPLSLG
jgi:hypothetical protein